MSNVDWEDMPSHCPATRRGRRCGRKLVDGYCPVCPRMDKCEFCHVHPRENGDCECSNAMGHGTPIRKRRRSIDKTAQLEKLRTSPSAESDGAGPLFGGK